MPTVEKLLSSRPNALATITEKISNKRSVSKNKRPASAGLPPSRMVLKKKRRTLLNDYSPIFKGTAVQSRVLDVHTFKKMQKKLNQSLKKLNQRQQSHDFSKGTRHYSTSERFVLKTIYEIFQFIGETELHIEKLR